MNQISASTNTWPQLKIANGTIEALKWLALVLMLGDHINKYILNDSVVWLYDAGRVAMPLFVFVLAYNLARPGALERGVYRRTLIRLAVFGLLASPAFLALGGLQHGWWPLNILFTLLVLTGVLRLLEAGTGAGYLCAALVFVLGGSLVEFWWPAIAFGVGIWLYCKKPSIAPLLLAATACAALGYINCNQWALSALLVLTAAPCIKISCPRVRWFFYAFYPAHLSIIWLARIPMRQAGYLFFT